MEPEIQNNQPKKREFISLPIALIIVALIIAGAILTRTKNNTSTLTDTPEEKVELAPVTQSDFIQGELNSPITIVEFSDTDCPYCIKFHDTMKELMILYPGKIKWVYRHFPIASLHPEAKKEAIASVCVAQLGGSEKFWIYLDKVFGIESSQDSTNLFKLPLFAKELGIDEIAFNTCLKSDEARQKVEEQMQMGVRAGVKGTPMSFLIVEKTGEQFPIFGAKSTEDMKEIIDAILK